MALEQRYLLPKLQMQLGSCLHYEDQGCLLSVAPTAGTKYRHCFTYLRGTAEARNLSVLCVIQSACSDLVRGSPEVEKCLFAGMISEYRIETENSQLDLVE